MDQVVYPLLVFIGRLFKKFIQVFSTSGFQGFEHRPDHFIIGRYVQIVIFAKHHLVRWIQSNQTIVVRGALIEVIEIPFKNIRHPVPAWPHIEGESLFLKDSGPSSQVVIFFEYGYLEVPVRKMRGGGEARESGTDDYGSFQLYLLL